jgi:hypothetical protein
VNTRCAPAGIFSDHPADQCANHIARRLRIVTVFTAVKINYMNEGQLVVVGTFGSGPEADVAKGALEAAGIDAMIQADTAGGCGPTLPGLAAGLNCWFARRTRKRLVTYLNPPTKSSQRYLKFSAQPN